MEKQAKRIDTFVRAPESIMFAQDLTSTEKVLICILIDKYLTMKKFNRLQPDGSFYITGKDLESKMDIKKSQILKKYIPLLERKGFINKISRPEDKEGEMKTYCFFTLNWDTILNHKGDKKDEAVQAKRVAKCEKMRQAMARTPIQETSTMTEPQPQVQTTSTMPQSTPFNIERLILPDFDDDEATRDIQLHPEMYDTGRQWAEYL